MKGALSVKNSIFAKPNGMWKEMLSANRIRLQEDFFKAQEIYLDKNNEWSGDWQGRDLLAQLCHTVFSGEPTDELQPLLDGFEEHLNGEGYFGEKIDPNALNEQQWAAYLKSGAAKAQKAREKRKAKAAGK